MIVVTGGAGFIGSVFVASLNEAGRKDILIVDELATDEKWRNLRGKSFEDYLHKNDFIDSLMGGAFNSGIIEAIIHLGAITDTFATDSGLIIENNYRYSRLLAEWSLEKNVRFIYASSASIYGDGSQGFSDDNNALASYTPQNPYAYSKQLFDSWVVRSGAVGSVAALRFFNVYGPNEYHKAEMRSVVHKAFEQVTTSGTVKLFRSDHPNYKDGEQKRDFVYVKDCAKALQFLLKVPKIAGIFNMGAGESRTYIDLANAVFKALGVPPNIEFIDMPEGLRDSYQYETLADISKFQDVGFPVKPTALETGVNDYINNYLVKANSNL